MSILVDKKTKVCVQGITGRDGAFHTKEMIDYGTNVVAGVTPGKGGQNVNNIPVFNTVMEAVKETDANTSVVYVPARFATDAIYEAIDVGDPEGSGTKIKLIVVVTEGIPTLEMLKIYNYLKCTNTRLIGPNSPGIVTPDVAKVGIIPGWIHMPGRIGVISRSGTLTYEVVDQLTRAGLGQSTCIGMGGDPIVGMSFIDLLSLFEADTGTDAVVLVGEIGGTDEEDAALFIKEQMSKPVVAFIAGRTAPPDKRMGHAGAIISGGMGTAESKVKAFESVGVPVATSPMEIPELVKSHINQ
ncbi:MAG: succinate--CoA ligase subunit alpha [Candidatus Stahlbacteria bacterium]|nr:succinate--CoA ligase subunit alpha [Candidatus Stahlbacteria bacterium]